MRCGIFQVSVSGNFLHIRILRFRFDSVCYKLILLDLLAMETSRNLGRILTANRSRTFWLMHAPFSLTLTTNFDNLQLPGLI